MDSEVIYQDLRTKILNLDFAPGTELKIRDLVNQFQVSRSPVRDALNRLAGEGLLTIIPQSGTKVSKIDLKIVREEQFLRTTLELGALSLFLKQANTLEGQTYIKEMEEIIESQTKAFEIRDMKAFLLLDNKFHGLIFKGAEKENCYTLIQTHSGNYQRIRRLSFSFDSISQGVLSEHKKLVDAFKNNQTEEAKQLDYEHINKLEAETKTLKENLHNYFK